MAKILVDTELSEIVRRVIDNHEIDDADQYKIFLESLAEVITDHFGGEVGGAYFDGQDDLGWTVSFYPNESLPADGGIFKEYDKNVAWKDGEEY